MYDVKTGKEAASHIVQVQLYMYLLPKSNLSQWKGMGGKTGGRGRVLQRRPSRSIYRQRALTTPSLCV